MARIDSIKLYDQLMTVVALLTLELKHQSQYEPRARLILQHTCTYDACNPSYLFREDCRGLTDPLQTPGI